MWEDKKIENRVSKPLGPVLAKMNYGPRAMYGVAKLFASPRGIEGEVNKTLIAGVILTDESLTPNNDIERMYECEVIIIPKRVFEENINPGGGAEIGSILLSGYGCRENYKREVTDVPD